MFDGLKRLWGRIVSMFNYTTLKNIIGKDVALSQTMIDAINKWKKMLFRVRVRNVYMSPARLVRTGGISRQTETAHQISKMYELIHTTGLKKKVLGV